ncbi:LysM peptidoglycan-binding domain-containing protein [Paenirhodobacter sp.]|uniref:LysM peptidoglycan-binding domain-containing protein n=1 Tax=Paenirhodobacter sp. TaxID=1965326 RepID=UPI003B3E21EE
MAEGQGGSGAAALRGGLAALALLAVGLGIWAMTRPEAPAPAVPAPRAAVAPGVADSVPQAAAVPAPVPETPAPVARFDMLRASPDGAVTVAGQTVPGARVEVLLDGAVADTVTAGADGRFASVLLAEPSANARVLTLRVTAGGVARDGGQSLTVAPSPVTVAAEHVVQAEALAETPILSEEEGVRVLAPASADLVIDTLAFDATGRVEISGRGAPSGVVLRAYVDTAEAGLTAPGAGGAWRMSLPVTRPGPHLLRVDALDAQGRVVARAETEFETAAPEVLRTEAGKGPKMVVIGKGLTLWAIARDTYGDPLMYVRVFEANRDQIRDPDLIYPGQVFTLPVHQGVGQPGDPD